MSTKLVYIDYEKSEALQREIDVFQQAFGSLNLSESEHLAQYPTSESYVREYMSRLEGLELQRQIDQLDRPCRILDVGVGRGESSIYLASKGHSVSVVEPSPALCKILERVANLYGLCLTIYNCNAEAINQIPEHFDIIIFNASFHHCDEPEKALANCYNILDNKGKVLLVNEPILQFFKTKSWFYNRLKTHPEEMGHYGGNEHIYRYHEYIQMLKKTGFSNVISQANGYNIDNQIRIQQLEQKILKGKPLYNFRNLVLKRFYYQCVYRLKNGGFVGGKIIELLKNISMLQSSFVASK